jgi:hypothetical protein
VRRPGSCGALAPILRSVLVIFPKRIASDQFCRKQVHNTPCRLSALRMETRSLSPRRREEFFQVGSTTIAQMVFSDKLNSHHKISGHQLVPHFFDFTLTWMMCRGKI